mgnify:FL=1
MYIPKKRKEYEIKYKGIIEEVLQCNLPKRYKLYLYNSPSDVDVAVKSYTEKYGVEPDKIFITGHKNGYIAIEIKNDQEWTRENF